MIDIAHFQTMLLVICIMAFLGGVFAGHVITSKSPVLHFGIKVFFALLAILGGSAAVLLVLLK